LPGISISIGKSVVKTVVLPREKELFIRDPYYIRVDSPRENSIIDPFSPMEIRAAARAARAHLKYCLKSLTRSSLGKAEISPRERRHSPCE
jgi:hypothetical protein